MPNNPSAKVKVRRLPNNLERLKPTVQFWMCPNHITLSKESLAEDVGCLPDEVNCYVCRLENALAGPSAPAPTQAIRDRFVAMQQFILRLPNGIEIHDQGPMYAMSESRWQWLLNDMRELLGKAAQPAPEPLRSPQLNAREWQRKAE
jgi:hypothetical protein